MDFFVVVLFIFLKNDAYSYSLNVLLMMALFQIYSEEIGSRSVSVKDDNGKVIWSKVNLI